MISFFREIMANFDSPLPASESPASLLFQETWPTILKSWGLSKTAGRIHAFLLAEGTAMSQDDIMGALDISRGGASTQLSILEQAGLVDRLRILGQRHDQFRAISDPVALFGALQLRHFRQTLRPLMNMSRTLSALASQQDLTWLTPIQGLGQQLETQQAVVEHILDSQ